MTGLSSSTSALPYLPALRMMEDAMSADEVAVLVEFLRRVVPRGPAEEELLVGLVEKLERVLPRAA